VRYHVDNEVLHVPVCILREGLQEEELLAQCMVTLRVTVEGVEVSRYVGPLADPDPPSGPSPSPPDGPSGRDSPPACPALPRRGGLLCGGELSPSGPHRVRGLWAAAVGVLPCGLPTYPDVNAGQVEVELWMRRVHFTLPEGNSCGERLAALRLFHQLPSVAQLRVHQDHCGEDRQQEVKAHLRSVQVDGGWFYEFEEAYSLKCLLSRSLNNKDTDFVPHFVVISLYTDGAGDEPQERLSQMYHQGGALVCSHRLNIAEGLGTGHPKAELRFSFRDAALNCPKAVLQTIMVQPSSEPAHVCRKLCAPPPSCPSLAGPTQATGSQSGGVLHLHALTLLGLGSCMDNVHVLFEVAKSGSARGSPSAVVCDIPCYRLSSTMTFAASASFTIADISRFDTLFIIVRAVRSFQNDRPRSMQQMWDGHHGPLGQLRHSPRRALPITVCQTVFRLGEVLSEHQTSGTLARSMTNTGQLANTEQVRLALDVSHILASL